MRYSELTEATEGMELYPELDPQNYQLIGKPDKWMARTYIGVTTSDPSLQHLYEAGNMGKVGYVMISTVDNTFIPIARGDEHHEGKDLLYEFVRDRNQYSYQKNIPRFKHLNPNNYVPIYALGNNYIDTEKEIPKYLIAIKKFLAMGGKDGILNGKYETLRDKSTYLSDFVASNGKFNTSKEGEISSAGKRIIHGFETAAKALSKARELASNENVAPSAKKAALNAAAKDCLNVYHLVSVHHFMYGSGNSEFLKSFENELRELVKANDVQGVTNLVFGFHSLKNRLHALMKEISGKPSDWEYGRMVKFFGNLDLAIQALYDI